MTPSVGIGKDNLTEARPIRATVRPEDSVAKRSYDCFLHTGIFREQFMRTAIGIEKLRRQMAEQSGGKTGFSRRDTPRDA
jgi:hypothetical protein